MKYDAAYAKRDVAMVMMRRLWLSQQHSVIALSRHYSFYVSAPYYATPLMRCRHATRAEPRRQMRHHARPPTRVASATMRATRKIRYRLSPDEHATPSPAFVLLR